MSDLLKTLDSYKFKKDISLSTDHCLSYVRQTCVPADRIIYTINIPNEHLRTWYDLKKEQGLLSQYSFVDVLNVSIAQYGIKLKERCTRVENVIYRSSNYVKSNCRKLEGRARVQYLSQVRKIAIRKDEVVNVGVIEEEMNRLKENKRFLREEIDQLEQRCEKLYQELQDALLAKAEIEEKLDDVENGYDQLESKNKELKEYTENVIAAKDVRNSGKVISDVGKRQQRRKLRELKTRVEKSLWFAETYGISLMKACFTDIHGRAHSLHFSVMAKRKNVLEVSHKKKKT